MNTLSNGFLFVCGLSWLLCEVCVSASGGSYLPLILYSIGFVVMFAILGCIPLPHSAIEKAGPVFAILIGAGILLYGFGSFGASFAGAFFRLLGGAVMIAFGVLAILEQGESSGEEASSH